MPMPLISTSRAILYRPPVSSVNFSLTFTASKLDTGGGTTVTYNSGGDPSIGAADSNRVVVVAIWARLGATASVASVSIAGVGATQVPSAAASAVANSVSDIWYASIPTGTTATISATYNGTTLESGIGVYSVITSTPTASGGNGSASSSDTSRSAALAIPAGGGLIGVYGFTGGGAASSTWSSSLGTVVEDVDTLIGSRHYTTAHDTSDAGSTPTITVTDTFAATAVNLSIAAWGP